VRLQTLFSKIDTSVSFDAERSFDHLTSQPEMRMAPGADGRQSENISIALQTRQDSSYAQ